MKVVIAEALQPQFDPDILDLRLEFGWDILYPGFHSSHISAGPQEDAGPRVDRPPIFGPPVVIFELP